MFYLTLVKQFEPPKEPPFFYNHVTGAPPLSSQMYVHVLPRTPVGLLLNFGLVRCAVVSVKVCN